MRCKSLLVIFVGLCCSVGSAQDSRTITSDPTDLSRPISTLLDQLRQREKIQVAYEDPRYSNSADLQDVTSKVAKSLSPAEEKFGPRMLREYEALGGPRFAVTREGGRFHVVPAEVLNVSGERTRQGTILDTVISILSAEHDGAQLLEDICDQVQKETGYWIDIGPD